MKSLIVVSETEKQHAYEGVHARDWTPFKTFDEAVAFVERRKREKDDEFTKYVPRGGTIGCTGNIAAGGVVMVAREWLKWIGKVEEIQVEGWSEEDYDHFLRPLETTENSDFRGKKRSMSGIFDKLLDVFSVKPSNTQDGYDYPYREIFAVWTSENICAPVEEWRERDLKPCTQRFFQTLSDANAAARKYRDEWDSSNRSEFRELKTKIPFRDGRHASFELVGDGWKQFLSKVVPVRYYPSPIGEAPRLHPKSGIREFESLC